MKLNTKHKAKIRREVDLELGLKPHRKIVFIVACIVCIAIAIIEHAI